MAAIAKKLAPEEIGRISAWLARPAGAAPGEGRRRHWRAPMPMACGGVAAPARAAGAPR